MCGGRQSSRRRTALLTVLAVIAAELMVLRIGHIAAALDVHETLPAPGADALARRRTPGRGAVGTPLSLPGRARAPSSTSAVSPMPVRNSTCVLRV
ncbi:MULTISPECIES: hypothetical protein [Rhodococcus]|uniref:hypothetical protein n=1 Tax=Rhodococcus TaxID=1827 RepID=UPI00042E8829|nr:MULTISPECIES: hypothetical protein [Rhodococcus]KXF55906.1 hypothetical protein AXA44_35840 [Rhodococcus sp. SC4]RZK81683.1 MAG: hypothetical protein EOP26_14435 [Rhodococcus sp. (in: high G+C Gram-positive bacteria)]AHK31054.1 hypothetical protein Pd630_LPD03841 [Rhodococcus opacus PD630]KXX58491.1 hypothetical protein AZG88_45535 [Rhodococcus sp. LB1]PBC58033.1 hypothetical protein CJ177_09460 [Rhodococcus sp. ACPA1]